MNNSFLYDEKSFYYKFTKDLLACQKEVIIESPFISKERMKTLYPTFEKLVKKEIKIYILTRDPRDHIEGFEAQTESEIRKFEALGVQVFICTGNHHRKLAILDRKILWEGSLNILSQIKSREIMRRIDSKKSALEMFDFLKLGRFI
ncbi:phospholipase D-like domain-containing protein [Patescibacteria group bacterium]